MNLHMPQDVESESELKNLAAVPFQLVSPANNSPIIGIYQDSMLGCYRFTRTNVNFTPRDAMNLLMMFNKVNAAELLNKNGVISSFDLLSQIMPPLTLSYKTKLFKDGEDYKTSNNVLEIRDGKYIRGQMDKGVLGAGSKGLIHRSCNDFGNMVASNFIDDLQNVITEYMKSSSFSVGISDLISDEKTNSDIIKVITEKKTDVKNLIDQTQIGVFDNNTGKTNQEEFETKVNNILNQASSEAGKIGLNSLNKDNRFVIMVNAGSKGSDLNISQMVSCLGQQNVDGKRIPYGFDQRTLPHFTKFDDSPGARGFVESSYINGLSPQELFFHAMGGRVGLIDTAVKTSSTGYIQRRLIKGLEDLMVSYDMTIRTNKNKIVQFAYGDDSVDTVKVENQMLPIVSMSVQDIYAHYTLPEESGKSKVLSQMFLKNAVTRSKKQKQETMEKCKKYTDMMINIRDDIIKHVFKNKGDSVVNCPVAFAYIINNIQGQQGINGNSLVDITPLEAFEMIEETYGNMEKNKLTAPTMLFKTLYYYYLSPKELLYVKRFNRVALQVLLDTIVLTYKKSIVAPGEMVGMTAGQSIGETSTQMSLPYFEKVKVIKKNKTTNVVEMISTTIGSFCDTLIEDNKEMTFNTGHVDSVETLLDNEDSEYYIIGVSPDEKTSWNKISHVSKHPVNGSLMRVKTRSGRTVETTTSHSHLIRNDNTVVPIIGADMQKGMRIPVAKYISNNFVNDTVTIGDKNYKLNRQFGWFVGAYLAEGSVSNGTISISNISSHYIESTKQIATLFGRNCRVTTRQCEYGPSTSTMFTYKPLADFLISSCCTGSFQKRVPDFAFTANMEFKAGLFQGYFDGDGNIQCDKDHHAIRCCSRSEQLIKDLSLILNYFDIFGTFTKEFIRGSYIYNLRINAKYAEVYKQHIDSVLHKTELDNIIEYIQREGVVYLSEQIEKINGLGPIIAKCGKDLKLPGQSRTYGTWLKKGSIGRRTLEKYINVFENHPNASIVFNEIQLLKQAINANVVWDEIVDIEIYTPDQNNYVYDFTVPAHQTFMTDYGVIVHNTLNTFHFAGVSSKSNVTRGVPRIEEILSLSSEPKNPSLTVYLKKEEETDREKAQTIMYMLEHTKLQEVVKSVQVCFDPDDLNTLITEDQTTMEQYRAFEQLMDECAQIDASDDTNEKSKWIIRMEMDATVMLEKNITMDDINFTLRNSYGDDISCVFSDYNSDKLVFRIRMNNILKGGAKSGQKNKVNPLDQSDQIYILKNFQDQLLNNTILRGVKGINKVILRKIKDNMVESSGVYKKQDIWVLDTIGTNMMDVLALDYIDASRTFSNNIVEVYETLGIEAARQTIYNELVDVIEFDGTYINYHHFSVLCDRMTYTHKMISIFRHGINNDNIGPIAKASFEETPEMFLKAARHAELDTFRGVSANVMCGQEGYYGTSAFQVVLDLDEMMKMTESFVSQEEENAAENIDKMFGNIELPDAPCSTNKLVIQNNVVSIKSKDSGGDNEYNPGF